MSAILGKNPFNTATTYFTPTNLSIFANTADGADNATITIGGGGAALADRGGYIQCNGNEAAGGGDVNIVTGNSTGSAITLNSATSSGILFYDTGLFRMQLTNGNLTFDATNGNGIVFGQSGSVIRSNTSDGTDNKYIDITGGGAGGANSGRGAFIRLNGNESNNGQLWLSSGNAASATAVLDSRSFAVRNSSAAAMWTFDGSNGDISQDATNGRNIVFSRASSGIRHTATTSITAAGSSISDAFDLTTTVNVITTAAASTGVQLWDTGIGGMVVVKNRGANPVNVYPDSGTVSIDGGANGAAVAIAAGSTGLFFKVSATNWTALEAGAA